MYEIKRWKTARGMYYLLIDGGKGKVTKFVKEFLGKIDPDTWTAEEKSFKKRKEGRVVFLEGENITIAVIDNHVFIKPEKEDVLHIIKNMIKLPEIKS